MWQSFVVILTLANYACGVDPGFKARITQRALDYANQQLVDAVAALVNKANIPDQSGRSGDVYYDLKNIRITGFSKPSSSISLVPNTGLTWTAANAGVSIHADWQVKYHRGWFKVSTSGSVDASASGISFSVTLAMGADSTGRPSIRSAGCNCNVGGVQINIHGDLAFILNLFKSEVQKRVRALLPDLLCNAINEAINNNAEDQLKSLPVVTFLMDKKFVLDYRLLSAPIFHTSDLETLHKGEITWAADPHSPPFSPKPLPSYASEGSMLYLWIGQYVADSFLYAAQRYGFLQYNLTAKDLPPDERGFLNTTCTGLMCVGNLIPVIGQKYPGCTVDLHMNSTTMPLVKIAPGQLEAEFAGDISFFVQTLQGRQLSYLLTLNVSATFNMTASVAKQMIFGNISGESFRVGVVKSAVGPLNVRTINALVGFAMKLFVIPTINEQGNKGFPLPVTGDIQFVNTQLQIQQNALMISTDLQYKINL